MSGYFLPGQDVILDFFHFYGNPIVLHRSSETEFRFTFLLAPEGEDPYNYIGETHQEIIKELDDLGFYVEESPSKDYLKRVFGDKFKNPTEEECNDLLRLATSLSAMFLKTNKNT